MQGFSRSGGEELCGFVVVSWDTYKVADENPTGETRSRKNRFN